jgi:outer membrane protein OmpA-like peptidoglycan-associated protein
MKDKVAYFSNFKSKENYVTYSTAYWNYAYADKDGWCDVDDANDEEKWINDFFPRYIAVLSRPQYKDNIVEIRIEGHTNSNGDYYSNMKLSQDRTRAVLQYCFSLMKKKDVNWLRGLVTANGLSSSHLILTKDGHEDKNLSRRVEFRVRTNAEKHLEDIADKRFNRKKND